jgi:hypothetical protein
MITDLSQDKPAEDRDHVQHSEHSTQGFRANGLTAYLLFYSLKYPFEIVNRLHTLQLA